MEIWTLWHPTYWLSGCIKAATALVLVYTVLELVSLVPKALALPSPAQLEAANEQLLYQINERKRGAMFFFTLESYILHDTEGGRNLVSRRQS